MPESHTPLTALQGGIECRLFRSISFGALVLLAVLFGCKTPAGPSLSDRAADASPTEAGDGRPILRYVGSSTIANFIEEAKEIYVEARFEIDTEPESLGGEEAIVAGETMLAGLACEPMADTIESGIRGTLLGTDTISIIANARNPVAALSLAELRKIYTGEVRNWKEFGGPDLTIVPLVVGENSATRRVFRSIVLGSEDYAPQCRVVVPDREVPLLVEEEPGAIGMISFSFLCASGVELRVVNVDGETPTPANLEYPIVRPLYLLWRPGAAAVVEFIAWTSTREAQELVEKCFGRSRTLTMPRAE